MKVLGVDPGLGTIGWAVLETEGRETYRVWGYGVIETPRARPLAERVLFLARALRVIIEREHPAEAAVEDLFIAKNSRTAASVGHGRGAILLTLAEAGLPIHEYNPRQVKVALTGYGAADKSQMQTMVQRLLRLKEIPKPDDAADALAIALCHINSASYAAGLSPLRGADSPRSSAERAAGLSPLRGADSPRSSAERAAGLSPLRGADSPRSSAERAAGVRP